MVSRRRALLLVSIVAVVFVGCVSKGQKAQIERFAVSTGAVVDATRVALDRAQDSEREYLVSEAIKRRKLNPDCFSPLLEPEAIRTRLRVIRRAGIRPCTIHDLRRSCLTNWAREVPAHVLHGLAGHSSMETTLKYYLSVGESDLEKARDVADAVVPVGITTDPKLTHFALNRQNGASPVAARRSADCPTSVPAEDLGRMAGWYARRDSNARPAV